MSNQQLELFPNLPPDYEALRAMYAVALHHYNNAKDKWEIWEQQFKECQHDPSYNMDERDLIRRSLISASNYMSLRKEKVDDLAKRLGIPPP